MRTLKDVATSLGYQCEEVHESIFLVYDFATDLEIKMIMSDIDSATEESWHSHYLNGIRENAFKKYGRSDIENLTKEGLIEITSTWADKNLPLKFEISEKISNRIEVLFENFNSLLHFDGMGTIQRQYEGAGLTEHVDNHTDPGIKYAVILYVNDDYSDGEVFFSKLDFEIKPPKKSLLIFPSGEKYWHGVRPPGSGPIRYVLPSFVRLKND